MRTVSLILFLAAVAACSPKSSTEGVVSLASSYAVDAPIRVQWGRLWEHPSQVAAVEGGRFTLPPQARFASAFVDLDGDGTLDRFYEPSARCQLSDGAWSCAVPRTSVFVHRYVRFAPNEVEDKVIAGADAFLPSGDVDWGPTLCTAAGECAQPNSGPFDTGLGRMLALCDLDGEAPAPVSLSFAGAEYSVERPEALKAFIAAAETTSNGDLSVRTEFFDPVSRAIVWLGTVGETGELRARLWDSESTMGGTLTADSFTATIPAAAVAACRDADCMVTVQLARDVPGPLPTLSVFEGGLAL